MALTSLFNRVFFHEQRLYILLSHCLLFSRVVTSVLPARLGTQETRTQRVSFWIIVTTLVQGVTHAVCTLTVSLRKVEEITNVW